MQSKCHTDFVDLDQNFEELDDLFKLIQPYPIMIDSSLAENEMDLLEKDEGSKDHKRPTMNKKILCKSPN